MISQPVYVYLKPTLRQLVNALRDAVINHPLATGTQVTHPVTGDPVLIEKVRQFDGPEYESSGLTLSIFPYYLTSGPGLQTTSTHNAALLYEVQYLGNSDSADATDKAVSHIILKLSYPGYALYSQPTITVPANTAVGKPNYFGFRNGSTRSIDFQINPAEEILQDWLENLRLILRDDYVRQFQGADFRISDCTVRAGVLNTPSWADKENVYYHSGYLILRITYYPPRNATEAIFPNEVVSSLQIGHVGEQPSICNETSV
jgi:hypothetical protein